MKKNVIILTKGLAGSSVLSSLLGRAGYWVGDNTYEKRDYNTFENEELISLNRDIFEIAGFTDNYEQRCREEFIDQVAAAASRVDGEKLQAFIARCNEHSPWLWKDPRLWLTIRVWRHWLNLDEVRFIVLKRDPRQSWISTTLRRQIQSRRYSDAYSEGIEHSIHAFLEEENASYHELLYEDLIGAPEETIAALNRFLETSLGVDDLKAVFKGDLYTRGKGLGSLIKAYLIYFKNYGERYDVR